MRPEDFSRPPHQIHFSKLQASRTKVSAIFLPALLNYPVRATVAESLIEFRVLFLMGDRSGSGTPYK